MDFIAVFILFVGVIYSVATRKEDPRRKTDGDMAWYEDD